MGKYIIEIPDDMIVSRELPTLAIKARFGNMRQFALDTGLKLMPYDDAEQRGADKAWELARWCFKDASDSDLERAFPFEWNHGGYRRIADMPYIQAAGRYEAWVKQEEERVELTYFKDRIFNALIEEGQNNASKYGFRLGDKIKFTPDQVVTILHKAGVLEKIGGE